MLLALPPVGVTPKISYFLGLCCYIMDVYPSIGGLITKYGPRTIKLHKYGGKSVRGEYHIFGSVSLFLLLKMRKEGIFFNL